MKSKYANNRTPEERRALWYKDDLRRCCSCNEHKATTEYHKNNENKMDGLCYVCKVCACANGARHHKRRMIEDPSYRAQSTTRWVRNNYGLTMEEYRAKLAAQNYQCGICSTDISTGQHLDHNHTTGKLRDFLCSNCNRGIGHLKESELILNNAISYLRKHNDE